jgi:hypothetical protein
MTEFKRVPSTYLSPLERPRCLTCVRGRMLLTDVETGPSGFDRRTFKCQKCGHVHTLVISNDPMESNVSSWLSDELSTPKIG